MIDLKKMIALAKCAADAEGPEWSAVVLVINPKTKEAKIYGNADANELYWAVKSLIESMKKILENDPHEKTH